MIGYVGGGGNVALNWCYNVGNVEASASGGTGLKCGGIFGGCAKTDSSGERGGAINVSSSYTIGAVVNLSGNVGSWGAVGGYSEAGSFSRSIFWKLE